MASTGLQQRHGRVLGQATARKALKSALPATSSPLASTTPTTAQTGLAVPATAIPTTLTNASLSVSPTPSPGRVDSPVSLTSIDSSSSLTSEETQSTLVCPICNESMVTLLQLNRHIDDIHSDIEEKDEDILKTWFKKKVEQAKQFHNVTLFNTKFAKLDIFDSEDSSSPPSESSPAASALSTSPLTLASRKPSTVQVAPPVRFTITKEHWQKPTSFDRCSDVVCDKTLNARNGSVNCRKCGKLFCTEHTRYQIKLDKRANHDPINGIWARCCETCYKSREGYFDTSGSVADISEEFFKARRRKTDIHELEVNKLEKRLAKLISALTDPKFSSNDNSSVLTYSKANQRRDAEKSVIKWQADSLVHSCPICSNQFGYTLRKHHCRLCGRVVCASLSTNCSREVPISLLVEKLDDDIIDSISFYHNQNYHHEQQQRNGKAHKNSREVIIGNHTNAHTIRIQISKTNDINIRLCSDCKNTLFSRRNFEADLAARTKPAIVRAYEALMPIRRSIDVTLPKFQRLLVQVNDPASEPSEETLAEAGKIRKKLMDGFVQLDNASRRVQGVVTETETEARLKKQVVVDITQYLQDHMIPLKALPKVLKRTAPTDEQHGARKAEDEEGEEEGVEEDTGEELSEHEIKERQEQLIILEEQKFLVSRMMSEASARRRFDEIAPLQQSVDELEREMDRIRASLGRRNQMI